MSKQKNGAEHSRELQTNGLSLVDLLVSICKWPSSNDHYFPLIKFPDIFSNHQKRTFSIQHCHGGQKDGNGKGILAPTW